MDNRRLIIAVVLSFGLMFGWTYFSQFMGWSPTEDQMRDQEAENAKKIAEANAQAPATNAQGQTGAEARQSAPGAEPQASAEFSATPGTDITVTTPLYTAVFNTHGGVLKSFTLNQYKATDAETGTASDKQKQLISEAAAQAGSLGIVINSRPTWFGGASGSQWSYSGNVQVTVESGEQSLTFEGRSGDVEISRTFTFKADTYVFNEKVTVASATPQFLDYSMSLRTGQISGPEEYMKATYVARQQNGSFGQEDDLKDLAKGQDLGPNASWAGMMGTYFLAAVIPADQSMNLKTSYDNNLFSVSFEKSKVNVGNGQNFEVSNSYYFGPKRVADLEIAPGNTISAIDYGWFGWVASPLLTMLKWLHGFVGNWGLSIIALTVLIKLVLAPLSYKSYKSMDNMRKLQPLMVKIREKYKDDKQRQNQEVMQLYKTYKVNPAGGCLPILVQLPIFLGLYRALLYSIELRQASFIPTLPGTDIIWLADLSLKDPLYITPIVMGATMFLQQKLTPTTGDPTQAKIMMFMPIIFTVLFINFPAGLVVYWLVNNVLSILQQYLQLRVKKS